MRNYIEFKYDKYGHITAEICRDGKQKTIRSKPNLLKLAEIVESYGYTVDREMKVVRYAKEISKDYEKYKKKQRRIQMYNNIQENMKLKRKSNTIGRKIAALSLAGIIATSTAIVVSQAFGKNDNPESPDVLGGQYIDYDNEESTEYIEYEDPNEIDDMLSSDSFHFSYEDRTYSENIDNVNQYDYIFQKYAKMYGVDANLLKAMACQESGGDHYGNLGNGPAEGIMQIEKSVHIGQEISAYNVETKEYDTVYVTQDNLQDIDFNIRVGAMDLRNALEAFNYNIPQGVQAYNYGIGGMNSALAACSRNLGVPQETLENTPSNNEWMNYRDAFDMGDSEYIEHVFSYLPNNSQIKVQDKDGNIHSINIINDYVKQNRK